MNRAPLWIQLLGIFALALAGAQPGVLRAEPPAGTGYYNEAYDASGKLRPQYRGVMKVYSRLSETRKKEFLRQTKKDFQGDNPLDPLPRVLTEEEAELLRRGTEQRGNVLRMLLQDYYSGRHRYAGVLPEPVMQRMLERSGETGFTGKVRPETIAFRLRLDVIRGPDGKFYVIEDNPGFVGGPGDLLQARESLMKRIPDYQLVLEPKDDPMEYYRKIVERARARAIPKDGRIVMYMSPPYADREDSRLRKIYQRLGVDVITPHSRDRLQVTKEGVFIRSTDKIGRKPMERVGFVILNGEHKWLDLSHPITQEQFLISDAQWLAEDKATGKKAKAAIHAALQPDPSTGRIDVDRLRNVLRGFSDEREYLNGMHRQSANGLVQAMLEGKVATDYMPGVDVIGDKEFYTYVPALTRLYLHEEPILENIPTVKFTRLDGSGHEVLDEKRLHAIFDGENYKKYVIKIVDGRGGDSVYVGPKITRAQIPEIIAKIRARPEAFIAQEFTHLSVLGDRIVDLGILADVSPKDTYVSPTFWGRAVPLNNKDGLVNLSKTGVESPVVVVDTPVPRGYRCLGGVLVPLIQGE